MPDPDRLTQDMGCYDPWETCGQDDFCRRGCHDVGGCTNGCIVPKLYYRLSQYEDTGTIEEFKLLKNKS
jgi:hypothetical protein